MVPTLKILLLQPLLIIIIIITIFLELCFEKPLFATA